MFSIKTRYCLLVRAKKVSIGEWSGTEEAGRASEKAVRASEGTGMALDLEGAESEGPLWELGLGGM